VTATAESRPGFLADVIVELGLASREEVDEARNVSKLEGRTLSEVLIERGTLEEQELAQAVAARYGLPLIDLDSFPIDVDAAQLVGRSTARRYGVAPAGFAADGALLLAMPDPTDSLARSDVAVSTRLEVRPVIAPRSQIDALIETLPERRAVRPVLGDDLTAIPPSGPMMWQSEKTVSPRGDGFAVDASVSSALKAADRFAETDSRGRPLRTSDSETRIARLCDQLSERDSQLARLRDEVSGLEAALAERDERLAKLERSAKHRDRALADLGKQLASATSSNGSGGSD
jgi:hypothetical protein